MNSEMFNSLLEDVQFVDIMNADILNESSLKSVVNDNFKHKGNKKLSTFRNVHVDKSYINKYNITYKFLKHADLKDDITVWMDKDKIVSILMIDHKSNTSHFITGIEVTKEYQGYGLGKQVLDYAVKQKGANELSVMKDNKVAIRMYEKYGFKKDKKDHGQMYFMHI